MSNIAEIREGLKRLIDTGVDNYLVEVKSVDETNMTATVMIGEVEETARLRSIIKTDKKGFVIIPANNTNVIIEKIEGSEDYYVKAVYDVDKIIYNEGNNGGLINIAELTSKLNNLKDEIKIELTKIQTGISSAGGAYTPGTITSFSKSDYEDETFKH